MTKAELCEMDNFSTLMLRATSDRDYAGEVMVNRDDWQANGDRFVMCHAVLIDKRFYAEARLLCLMKT